MTRAWLVDTLERAGFTWLEAFVGLLVVQHTDAMGEGLDLAMVEVAAVSALISALAVVKAALAARQGAISPASLVRDPGTR